MRWLLRLFRGRALDRDLDREVRAHLALLTDDLIRSGLAPEEARRQAALAFGGVDAVKEASRDARGTRVVEDWWQDTRYAFRALRRAPAFTAAAVATLGIGIGANTAVWSVLDALVFRALPLERSEELVALRHGAPGEDDSNYLISYPQLGRFQNRLPPAVRLGGMSSTERGYLADGERNDPVNIQLVTPHWFQALGVGAGRGRVFGPGDESPDGATGQPVAVLSDGYWAARFGRDPEIVGKPMRLNGVPLTIAGIAESGFGGLTVGSRVDLWIPTWMQSEIRFLGNSHSRDSDTRMPWPPQNGIAWLTVVGRVPAEIRPQTEAMLAAQYRAELVQEHQGHDSTARARALRQTLVLEPLAKGFSPLREQFGYSLRVLMVGVGVVLLIACANLASLLMARGAAREQEIALRVSLGARPSRLLRQALTESLTLALLGGIVSPVVAWWGGLALLRAASTGPRPIPLALALDARVLGFAFLLTLATGLLFGMAPALRAARTAASGQFRAGGRVAGPAPQRLPLGRVLVATQVALSLVLVAAAGLFVQTLRNFLRLDPGYASGQVIGARIEARQAGYRTDELPLLYRRLIDAVGAVPGVRSVGLAMHGLGMTAASVGAVRVADAAGPDRPAQVNYVTPGYFATVGMVLVRGREFTEADRVGTPEVAVVSQAFARKFFGTDDVIGRRVGWGEPWFEIVGVVRDARVNAIKWEPALLLFRPLAQGPKEYVLSVEARIAGQPAGTAAAIRAAIAQTEPRLPIREVVLVSDLLERGLSREQLLARLAGVFSAMALLLAAIGLYGVVAYSVARRTNEMAIRIALGAVPLSLWGMVLRGNLAVIVAGLVLGLGLWVAVRGLTRNLVFGLSPGDPVTLGISMAVLALVGIIAASVPAWRATRVDPASALREQ